MLGGLLLCPCAPSSYVQGVLYFKSHCYCEGCMATVWFSACEPEFYFLNQSVKIDCPPALCLLQEFEQISGVVPHQTHDRLVLRPNHRPVAGNRDCSLFFPCIFLFTRHNRVNNLVHKCPPLVPVLSQINSAHAVLSHLRSTLILSFQVFREVCLLQVPHPAPVCISLLHYAWRLPLPGYLP